MKIKLKASEAAVILRTNQSNIDAAAKRILQKVVDKRPLSEDEIGELEGIVANEKFAEDLKAHRLTADANTPQPVLTPDKISESLKHFEQEHEAEERRALVLEMRTQHPPVPIREIAKRLQVTTDTVQRDMRKLKDRHAKILGGEVTLQMLGQTVSQYDILYGKAMALSDQFTNPMAKAAFIRTAISALDSKSKLMGETGIIHRVPERQEILVAHADAGTVMGRVQKLIKAQEQRKAPVLELAPAIEAEAPQADAEVEPQ